MEFEPMLDAMQDIHRPPYQVLSDLLDNEYDFAMRGHPQEEESDEEPRKIDNRREWWPIDEVLGRYDPTNRSITLYRVGIKAASERVGRPAEHLGKIVRIHEYAHAIFHVGLTQGERMESRRDEGVPIPRLEEKTAQFRSVEVTVHESLAQLMTLHAIHRMIETARHAESRSVLEEMLRTFWSLNQIQPPEYRVDDFKDIPRRRIVKGFGLLKNSKLQGDWDTWKTVLTW